MRISDRTAVVLAGALAGSSCTSIEPATTVQDEHAAAAETPAAAPTRTPVQPSAKPAVEPEPAVKMQLHPIVRGYLPLALHETADGSTFVVAGPLAIRVPSTGALVRDPHALDGRETPDTRIWSIASFGGRFPDALTMVTEMHDERASYGAHVLRWNGNAWKPVKNVVGSLEWRYGPMQPWIDGSVLTQRTYGATNLGDTDFFDLPEDEQAKFQRAIAKVTPDRFEVLASKSSRTGPRFGSRAIDAYASLPSGHLFAIAGREALHWKPGTDEPDSVQLPEEFATNAETRVWAFAPDDVVAVDFGEAAVRFDGTAWKRFHSPADTDVGSMSRAPDGTLWLVKGAPSPYSMDDNQLWRRMPGADWERMQLPAVAFPAEREPAFNSWSMEQLDPPDSPGEPLEMQPMEVHARTDGLWLTVATFARTEIGGFRWALLHDEARDVLDLPEHDMLFRERSDLEPIRKFTGRQACRVFVPIDVAADAPATEIAALRDDIAAVVDAGDAKLVEIALKGERRIGAWLREADPAKARTLVAAIRKRVGERAGAPICRDAILKRVF